MSNPIRVAAYARVSTDKDDQANSFESQVKYFAEYIDRQENWKLVKVYSDEGISGTSTRKREGFNNMINDVMSGKIDFIVTKEVSRFARNTVDTLEVTRALREKDVGVYFMLDNINTLDTDGEFRLTIMASLAQDESRKTSERVKWGQQRQMEKGVVFGRDMLGYDVSDGKLYLVEEGAEIVRKIYYKYVIEDKGTYIIARELKEEGIKPCNPDGTAKYENDWSHTQILRILRNEKYVGDLCQKKTYTKNFLDHKKRYNRGEEEMIYITDHHPDIAIISREMWNAAQKKLQSNSPTAEQKAKHSNRYWASGKIFCGECGAGFVSRTKKTSAGTSKSWKCGNHVKGITFRNAECSMGECASDKSMKNVVLYILNRLVANKDELKAEIVKEISQLNYEVKANPADDIQDKIDKLEQKKMKLLDIRLSEEISKDDFKKKNTQLEQEISELQVRLKEIRELESTAQNKQDRMDCIIKEIDRVLKLDSEDMDELLGAVTEKITVHKGHTVVVNLKDIPYGFKVTYKSTGKLDTYRTEILDINIV